MYFQVYKDAANYWRWRLKSANHEIVAQGESYYNKQDCLHAVGLVMGTTTKTPVYEA